MTLILGLTGMDPATEAQLRETFAQALPRLGGFWQLGEEEQADHVVVDMDSMYGPMSWIRLHASGKRVIGLTSAARTQADHHLPRPLQSDALSALLEGIAAQAPASEAAPRARPGEAADAAPAADAEIEAFPDIDPPSASASIAVAATGAGTQARTDPPPMPGPAAVPAEASEPVAGAAGQAPAAAPRDEVLPLSAWLQPGALSGRWQVQRAGLSLAIDADAGVYRGPTPLKPLAPLFDAPLSAADMTPLDQAAWEAAGAGAPEQPLARLQWLGGLLAGKGALVAPHDPEGQYRLTRWPQTEREFPKHFRIATAMMRGPVTVAGLATASGVAEAEVADFVNANLATGFAEPVQPAAAAPAAAESGRAGGLLGRLRAR